MLWRFARLALSSLACRPSATRSRPGRSKADVRPNRNEQSPQPTVLRND
jgi:hypothetical protein